MLIPLRLSVMTWRSVPMSASGVTWPTRGPLKFCPFAPWQSAQASRPGRGGVANSNAPRCGSAAIAGPASQGEVTLSKFWKRVEELLNQTGLHANYDEIFDIAASYHVSTARIYQIIAAQAAKEKER